MKFQKLGLVSRRVVFGACATLLLGTPVVEAQLDARDPQNALTAEALAPLIGGSTAVTLRGKDIPLKTAVEQLLKAAQLPLEGVLNQKEETHPVTVNWNQTPFWEAAQDLERQTNLQWINMSFGGAGVPLRLGRINLSSARSGLNGLTGAKTPLAVLVASQVTREARRVLNLGNPAPDDAPEGNHASVQVTAYFDPRLSLLPNSVKLQMTTPANERVVNSLYNSASITSGGRSVGIHDFQIPIVIQGNATKIPLIAGSLLADVVMKSETWEAPNITVNKTATREIKGVTYKLEDVTLDGDQLTVKVAAQAPTPQARFGSSTPPIRILDGEGNVVPSHGSGTYSSVTDGHTNYKGDYRYSLHIESKDFPGGEMRPGPFKLVWDIPTEVKTLKVPFEFRDVPLP